jgi:hypothetical protein
MISSKHINLRATPKGVDLLVDDYELFDYIDDFLTDLGFVSEFAGEEILDGRRWYFMHFEGDAAHISRALDGLSAAEVDRIWAVNNSDTSSEEN